MYTMKSARKLYKRMCSANANSDLPAHTPGFKKWARALFAKSEVNPKSIKLMNLASEKVTSVEA